jgi:hypothetical protein
VRLNARASKYNAGEKKKKKEKDQKKKGKII